MPLLQRQGRVALDALEGWSHQEGVVLRPLVSLREQPLLVKAWHPQGEVLPARVIVQGELPFRERTCFLTS